MAVAKPAVQLQKRIKIVCECVLYIPQPLVSYEERKKKNGKTSYGVSRREKNWKKKLLVQKIQT